MKTRSEARSRSGINALPEEMLVRCLEYLPLLEVSENKQISKSTRTAARRALRRGRWQPVFDFVQRGQGLVHDALMSVPVPDRSRLNAYPPSLQDHGPLSLSERLRVTGLSAAALSLFRAAWALEHAEVFWAVNNWIVHDAAIPTFERFYVLGFGGQFLAFVEPTSDSFGRILAACEYTYGENSRQPITGAGHDGRPALVQNPGIDTGRSLIDHWAKYIGCQEDANQAFMSFSPGAAVRLPSPLLANTQMILENLPNQLGEELQSWRDPEMAAGFAWSAHYEDYAECNWPGEPNEDRPFRFANAIYTHALHLTKDWQDRSKADLFLRQFYRVQREDDAVKLSPGYSDVEADY